MLSVAYNKRFFLKQKYFIRGESTGHFLSTIVRSQKGSTHVSRLVVEIGREITDGADILAAFKLFYGNLYTYTSRSNGEAEALRSYLAQVSLPCLSENSRLLLDQPLTLEELERALQLAPNEKAPGSDSLTAEFF